MTNTKTTKRALFASVLSLLLCISMLIGSTFAWFTDTASTTVNSIQSGTIDIRLTDKKGNNMEGKTLKWVDAKGNSDILWEPGCTFVTEPVRLWNHSNLSFALMTYVSGFSGDMKLLEALEIKVVDAATIYDENGNLVVPFDEMQESYLKQWSDAHGGFPMQSWQYGLQADWTTDSEGVQTEHPGKGEPKPIEDICIVAHMKEEAGNEYQGLTLTGAALTFKATQLTDEYDSYGRDYDADATYETNEPVVFESGNHTVDLSDMSYIVAPEDIAETFAAVKVNSDSAVTLKGEGTVKVEVADPNTATAMAVWARNGGDIVIEGGTYILERPAENTKELELIYASDTVADGNTTTITIKGGIFKCANAYKTINIHGNGQWNDAEAFVYVMGGTFWEFNPAADFADGGPEDDNVIVPDGYKVVSEVKADGTWYTVVPVE